MKLKKLILTPGHDHVDFRELFRQLAPWLIFGGVVLFFTFIWDEYDSYGECMYEYEFEKSVAEAMCPGCNDWRKKDNEAKSRCLDYIQHWEW